MRKYIRHLLEQGTPHERRAFAARTAGVLTTALFVVWAASFGVRLANPGAGNPSVAGENRAQTAAVINYPEQANTLEVATTSVFTAPTLSN